MMASEQPAPPIPTEAPPPETSIPAPPEPKPTHGTIKASPFLNGFDLVLAIGAIVLGFAIASFAVRNSDFWLHLGAGRLIAQGENEFGKAPFTYAGADRYWVNHSWLYDLLTYKIFSLGDGQAIVVFKSIIVALTTFLLLSIRKPGTSLWIGVLAVGLALLVSAPRLLMQPTIISCFFLVVTLYLLIQMSSGRAWRLPAGLGITFALWANCDQWFVLGPVTVALFLLGEFLQQKLTKPVEGEERRKLKPVAVALAVGVAACMINPHHVRIWQAPAELAHGNLAAVFEADSNMASIFRTSFEQETFDLDGSRGGNPINAFAFVFLVLLNVLGIVLNRRHLSWGLLLVNIAALVLGVLLYRAIVFYAVVAAPATALNLGAALLRLHQQSLKTGILQLIGIGRVGVRMGLLLCGLVALVVCWPGWLQPFAQQRRLAFEVDISPTLEKTARMLHQIREEAKLPADAHSLILNVDLANYCAWFAPDEKTYFDLRLDLHAPEAESFAALQKQFLRRSVNKPLQIDAGDFLTEHRITHVVVNLNSRPENFAQLLIGEKGGKPAWELWRISDQYCAFGWRPQKIVTTAQFNSLRFDPKQIAFGADVEPMPDAPLVAPPPPRGLEEKFLTAAPSFPGEADEAALLQVYDGSLRRLNYAQIERERSRYFAQLCALGGLAGPFLPLPGRMSNASDQRAAALLAVRAARRSIIQSPEHPAGYLRLGLAQADNALFGLAEPYQRFLYTASLERYFVRSTPDQWRSDVATYGAAKTLIEQHCPLILLQTAKNLEQLRQIIRQPEVRQQLRLQQIRIDLALEAMKKARAILQSGPQGLDEEQKALDVLIERWEKEVRTAEDTWLNNEGRSPIWERANKAQREYFLCLKSLETLKKLDFGDERVPLQQRIGPGLALAQLQLLTGKPEQADQLLEYLRNEIAKAGHDPDEQPELREMRIQADMVLGRFSDSIKIKSHELASLQIAIDQATKQLPLAIATHVYRPVGAPRGLPLMDLMLDFQVDAFARGFRDQSAQALYNEYFLRVGFRNLLIRAAQLHFDLGLIYLEQGDNTNSARHFQQMLQTVPGNFLPDYRMAAQSYLGMMRLR